MKALWLVLCVGTLALGAPEGRRFSKGERGGVHQFESLSFRVPTAWGLVQDARLNQTLLLGLTAAEGTVNLRVFDAPSFKLSDLLTAGAQVTEPVHAEAAGPFTWDVMAWTHRPQGSQTTVYGRAFSVEFMNRRYVGWATAATATAAKDLVQAVTSGVTVNPIGPGGGRSLTGVGYTGKKYYVGFGDHLSGFMGNEVKYDIAHTHDVFTKSIGGDYIGTKLVGPGMGSSALRTRWKELKSTMTGDDMYVQYSAGHGSPSGLAYGVSYDEIRDNALSYPASEVVVFIMACHSGGLVNSFDKKKSEWQDWPQKGRTLMVLASSKQSETSSTGPMTDPQEPGGPSGSAGSAFGHALWKALIGHSDGFVDGVKDGFISLGEIRDFSTWKTKSMAGHTPVSTGAYQPTLVMNRVPSRAELAAFEGGTEGLSDEAILERIQELDSLLRLR